MGRVLVTGGAGYIGSHSCKALAAAGYEPVVYDNLSEGHRSAARWGPLVVGDLSDRALLTETMRRYGVQAVMHFAAHACVGESVREPRKYFENNVVGTLSLVHAMLDSDIDRLVFSSTCATFGVPDVLPITQDTPQAPVNPYGASKLMVERVLRAYEGPYGLRYCALRYFNAAGADPEGELGEQHDPETHLIPLVIAAAQGLVPWIEVFGTDYETPDGTAVRDYVHVSDLADAHVLALKRLLNDGASACFNLGAGAGHSVREVIRMVEAVSGRRVPVREGARRPGDPAALVASAVNAEAVLGWRACRSDLRSIVESAWCWHQRERPPQAPEARPATATGVTRLASPPARLGDAHAEPDNLDPIVTDDAPSRPPPGAVRPTVRGKFLFVGEEKLWVRGVTYGTFEPDEAGSPFPSAQTIERDFAAMASAGLNAVRVYTVPPRQLLDIAARHGLRVMIGLPWPQHLAFLDDRATGAAILAELRDSLRPCAGHPAVLCYAVGNEIPAPVVRWSGKRRIERFIAKLCALVRREDPGALVTYVSYPTTEYLDVGDVDLVTLNVYLETEDKLSSYLGRLQNLAGERPLLMGEIGLDSGRNGEDGQAASLAWQIRTTFEAGCIGAFVFAWTDEWHRGGASIDDWDFGLTTRDRRPKAALATVTRAFSEAPLSPGKPWPRVSVVVCSFNGSSTIRETLEGLSRLNYPDYEVIVVNDGSTDATGEIARAYEVNLIETENRGLSSARNTGREASTAEIVAYIDDDAYPDPDWLLYLAWGFLRSEHAVMGGPNLAPPGDGEIGECVANAPGGPLHVLLDDELAEHVPGCNMAFRKDRLAAIGGFDPRYRVAGDDVDVCWRIQDRGWTIGFHPAAMVWHHRRNSIARFWKQQRGYARAEALLAEKWPEKYNSAGHLTWHGRIYGRGVVEQLFTPPRVYHGTFGGALFQSVYDRAPGRLSSLPLMPEWYVLLAGLGLLTGLGVAWAPLFLLTPVFALALFATLERAVRGGWHATFHSAPASARARWRLRAIVAWLHLLQPAARLLGRIEHRLGPWRRRGRLRPVPATMRRAFWSERWRATEQRLEDLERVLRRRGAMLLRGGDFDRWDLTVQGGLFGGFRLLAMAEEHGSGKQLLRFRAWARASPTALAFAAFCGLGALGAGLDHAWAAALSLALLGGGVAVTIYGDCAAAADQVLQGLAEYAHAPGGPDEPPLHPL